MVSSYKRAKVLVFQNRNGTNLFGGRHQLQLLLIDPGTHVPVPLEHLIVVVQAEVAGDLHLVQTIFVKKLENVKIQCLGDHFSLLCLP